MFTILFPVCAYAATHYEGRQQMNEEDDQALRNKHKNCGKLRKTIKPYMTLQDHLRPYKDIHSILDHTNKTTQNH